MTLRDNAKREAAWERRRDALRAVGLLRPIMVVDMPMLRFMFDEGYKAAKDDMIAEYQAEFRRLNDPLV